MQRTEPKLASPFSALTRHLASASVWLRRRTKHARDIAHVQSLPDALLKDIGTTRYDVARGRLPKRD